MAQPEVGRGEVGPAVGAPRVVGLRPGELTGILPLDARVAGAELGREDLQPRHRLVERREHLGENVSDRGAGGEVRFLPQIGHVLRAADAAGVGFVDAGEQAHQGGLAGAVLADEADRFPRVGDEVDPVEHGALPEAA